MPFDRLVRALALRPGEPAILGWAWLYVLALMAALLGWIGAGFVTGR